MVLNVHLHFLPSESWCTPALPQRDMDSKVEAIFITSSNLFFKIFISDLIFEIFTWIEVMIAIEMIIVKMSKMTNLRPDSSLCQRGRELPPLSRSVVPTSLTLVSVGQTDLCLGSIIHYIQL